MNIQTYFGHSDVIKRGRTLLAGVSSIIFAAIITIQTSALASKPTAVNTGYNLPPKNILDVMLAPRTPRLKFNPTRDTFLLTYWQNYPSIARVSEPFLRLAGARIEPKNHSKHDTPGGYGITPCAEKIELFRLADSKTVPLILPQHTCPGNAIWSTDGKKFALTIVTPTAVELWIGDSKNGKIRRVPNLRLNQMLGDEVQWMPGQQKLLVKAIPAGLRAPPARPVNELAPSIQETTGQAGQSSTYEARDTLNNSYDEKVFDFYAVSQLALLDASTLQMKKIGDAGIYADVTPAPKGTYLLVGKIHRPYSYITTFSRFPREFQAWNIAKPNSLKIKTLWDRPLADRVPIHGVNTGPRDFEWRTNDEATLIWAEAQDGGDWNVKVPFRDRILMQKAPFDTPAIEIAKTEQRFASISWTEKKEIALLEEYDANRNWERTSILNVDNPTQKPEILWDMSSDEKYKHPGSPVYRWLENGNTVIQIDGDSIYLSGQGASLNGDRPFLDRLNLKTKATERLFRSENDALESFIAFQNQDTSSLFTWRQTVLAPPNVYLRKLEQKVDAPAGEAIFKSSLKTVTNIQDPTPEVRKIKKRLVKYKRADGVELSFTLYTPPDYKEGTRLPTILNAYPLDYADAAKAGQISGSENTFTNLYQYSLLLLQGYAVIDRAAFPIVGDPKKAYDTYLEQLVANAKAAVDEAVRLGVADPDRIAVTGHSHGALMTVNLLAHSNLFRAGAATSGSYNKTLTPFGFQSERRSVWEALDVYRKVSPFFVADKIKTPLLIVHGSEDANPGTTPLQATKLYEAIRGNGGIARLVMLPGEPHWYSALESNEQLVYEMLQWFDKHVKNAPTKLK